MEAANGTTWNGSLSLGASGFSYNAKEKAEIIYYLLIIALGLPLNIAALVRSVGKLRGSSLCGRRSRARVQKARELLLLTLNLNITDLLIICVYLPTQIAWRLTVLWAGGDVMCRALRFVYQLAFHLSSSIIACIATEKFLAVRRSQACATRRRSSIVPFLFAAWIWSIVCSLPSLYIWQTFTPWPDSNPDYAQCTTYFIVQHYLGNDGNDTLVDELRILYHLGGALTVFWLPLTYITIIYSYIFIKLRKFGLQAHITMELVEPDEESEVTRTLLTQQSTDVGRYSMAEMFRRLSSALHTAMLPDHSSPTLMREDVGAPRVSDASRSLLATHVPKWRLRLRSKHRVFSQTGLLVIVYLACWLPYFVGSFGPDGLKVLGILIGMNAAVDPLVYAFDG